VLALVLTKARETLCRVSQNHRANEPTDDAALLKSVAGAQRSSGPSSSRHGSGNGRPGQALCAGKAALLWFSRHKVSCEARDTVLAYGFLLPFKCKRHLPTISLGLLKLAAIVRVHGARQAERQRSNRPSYDLPYL
jgi:hypothetical protein